MTALLRSSPMLVLLLLCAPAAAGEGPQGRGKVIGVVEDFEKANPEGDFGDPAAIWDNATQEGLGGFRERVGGPIRVAHLCPHLRGAAGTE